MPQAYSYCKVLWGALFLMGEAPLHRPREVIRGIFKRNFSRLQVFRGIKKHCTTRQELQFPTRLACFSSYTSILGDIYDSG